MRPLNLAMFRAFVAEVTRQRSWRRPRRRVYPEKAKTGIRATYPNEYWHIDVMVMTYSCRLVSTHAPTLAGCAIGRAAEPCNRVGRQ